MGVTPFHRYYGLLPHGFNGHFLPFRNIAALSAWHFLPWFRCSLCRSLTYTASAVHFDPLIASLSATGWTGGFYPLLDRDC